MYQSKLIFLYSPIMTYIITYLLLSNLSRDVLVLRVPGVLAEHRLAGLVVQHQHRNLPRHHEQG